MENCILFVMKKYIARLIWDFSECFKIPLGRFAPIVFWMMLGSEPTKIKEDERY